ncbi:MAG: 2-oxoglutarate and iron-dependent oxygenase domain-containing protein [Alphaproteobacteria bacterium]|nr:2-oxoglutarate and iron-dependent oxygenase domain-containing protein [Alphaproteobacteria bacterium]
MSQPRMSQTAHTEQPAPPVIDIADLRAGGEDALHRVAAEIRAAMALSGFFYLSGHGLPDAAIANLRAAARAFFAGPAEVKRTIAINQFNRGYLGPGEARMHGASHTDLKEVFFWGRDLAADDPDVLAGVPLCGPNQWPAEPPGFRDAVSAYFEAIGAIGRDLLRAFAVSLGADPDFFVPHYDRPMARGQLIHYPPPPEGAPLEQFGVAPHTDFGCITLLLQETAGLEAQLRSGAWVAVPPLPGTLVINIGDLLQRWSNGRYPSTRHRVRNSTGQGRYSIAIFFDPSPSAVVDPQDLSPDDPPAFEPVEAAAYILGRNKGAFAHYDPTIAEDAD